jgi:hypothetical protein
MAAADSHWGTEGNVWDYDFDVKDGHFEVSQFDKVQLILTGYNHEVPHKGDEMPIFLSVGSGFEVVDAGKAIEPLPGKKKFHASSKYGRFTDSFAAVADSKLVSGRDPWKADCFIGLTLSIHQEEETYKIDGRTQTGRVITVTGVHETEAPKPAKRGRAAAAEKVAGDAPVSNIPAGVASALKTIAGQKDTYEEYVDEAYEVIGSDILNQAWEDEVTSQQYYDSLKG